MLRSREAKRLSTSRRRSPASTRAAPTSPRGPTSSTSKRSVRFPFTPLPEITYRVVVEYDGTNFSGFQFQPQIRTVAGELETALSRLFDQPVKITGAGRTDAGVHAVGQVVSFRAHDRFPIERLGVALGSNLPRDISARDPARVPDDFSARFHALERHYTYHVHHRSTPSALLRRFVHHEHRELDDAAIEAALAPLTGTHDFASFCSVPPENGITIRTLRSATVERSGEMLRFDLRADGFLHRMVRIIVGTALDAGAGKLAPGDVAAMLDARDRREAGTTAPPHGLVFAGVRYEDFDSHPAAAPFMWDRSGRR